MSLCDYLFIANNRAVNECTKYILSISVFGGYGYGTLGLNELMAECFPSSVVKGWHMFILSSLVTFNALILWS